MKKYLAFAAFMAFIGIAPAAQLGWTATVIYEPGTTTLANGYSIYLFITEQSGSFGADITTVSDITSLIKSKGDVASKAAANASITAGRAPGQTGYNGNNFAAGDSLSAFAVIFDAADAASASNYILTETKSVSWKSGTGTVNLPFGSQKNATWTAVPEPSTAVLAFAGLALLLKRRKA